MIQRIQTVYLFIVILAGILQFFLPVAMYFPDTAHDHFYHLSAIGMKYVSADVPGGVYINFLSTLPMAVLVAFSVILSAVAIFTYKKRMRQVLLVNTAFLINVILIALIFLLYSNRLFAEIVKSEPSYKLGAFLPVISVIFLVLASTSIRKDEALVRSADRLR